MPSTTSIRPKRRRRPNFTPEERALIVDDYEVGLTYRAIASKYGIAQGSVINVARSAPSFGTRHNGRGDRLENPTSEDLEMSRLRREGKTLEEVGQVFGITRERVRQRLDRFDLDIPVEERHSTICMFCDERITRGKMTSHREAEHPKEYLGHSMVTPEIELKREYVVEAYLRGDKLADISRAVRTNTGQPSTYAVLYRILHGAGVELNRGGGAYVRTPEVKARMSAAQRGRRRGDMKPRKGWRADDE